jgi:hypothetical protein
MNEGITNVLLDTRVLVTFIICTLLAAIAIWVVLSINNRRHRRALEQQRGQQEGAVSRILDSMAKSKDEIISDYESQLAGREQRLAALVKENKRLKDRMAQGGLMGMFGGGQRELVSALLLENEQLHELLAQKQEQLRDSIADLSNKLVERMDEQLQESANAIRYKQVLLSAFLQQEEARLLLDRLIAEGRLSPAERPRLTDAASAGTASHISDWPAEASDTAEPETLDPEPEPDVQ